MRHRDWDNSALIELTTTEITMLWKLLSVLAEAVPWTFMTCPKFDEELDVPILMTNRYMLLTLRTLVAHLDPGPGTAFLAT